MYEGWKERKKEENSMKDGMKESRNEGKKLNECKEKIRMKEEGKKKKGIFFSLIAHDSKCKRQTQIFLWQFEYVTSINTHSVCCLVCISLCVSGMVWVKELGMWSTVGSALLTQQSKLTAAFNLLRVTHTHTHTMIGTHKDKKRTWLWHHTTTHKHNTPISQQFSLKKIPIPLVWERTQRSACEDCDVY